MPRLRPRVEKEPMDSRPTRIDRPTAIFLRVRLRKSMFGLSLIKRNMAISNWQRFEPAAAENEVDNGSCPNDRREHRRNDAER